MIVVDNGPGDLSNASEVLGRYPDIHYHWMGDNLGFSGGCNAGIQLAQSAGYDQFLILNNDVKPNADAIRKLERVLHDVPEVGISGPVTYYPASRSPLYSGARINWRRGKYKVNPEEWPYETGPPYDVDIVSGCAMMLSLDTVDRIGMFDDRYFLYWEDVDLCARARKAGLRTVMVPGARMDHRLSATTGSGSPLFIYYETRNRLLFFEEHANNQWLRGWLVARLTLARSWMGVRRWLLGDRAAGKAYLSGVLDYHRRRFGSCVEYDCLNGVSKEEEPEAP